MRCRIGILLVFASLFFTTRALADSTPDATPTPPPETPAPTATLTPPPTPLPLAAPQPQPQPQPEATAAPKRFGEPGTFEIEGGLSIYTETSKTSDADSSTLTGGSSTTTYSRFDFEPYVGYFVADGAELTGGLVFISDRSSTTGGLGFGDGEYDVSIGGALLPGNLTDTFRIGPAVEVRFANFRNRNTDASGNTYNDHLTGPDASVMLMAKSVFGRSSLLTADVGYHHLASTGHVTLEGSGSTTEHYTTSGFFTGVGFGVWF